MEIKKRATAGTLESSDVYVEIEPGNGIVEISLSSVVMGQFGEKIRETVADTLLNMGVTNAKISLNDRGAVDCVLRARIETAVKRGGEQI